MWFGVGRVLIVEDDMDWNWWRGGFIKEIGALLLEEGSKGV